MNETDGPDFGVNFETGDITQPVPDSTPPDEQFDAFEDEGGDEQQPAGSQPGRQAPEMLPKYRLDQANEQLRQSREEIAELRELVRRLTAMPQGQPSARPDQAPRPEIDPTVARVRDQFLRVFPEMKDFLDNRDRLLKAAEISERHDGQITSMQKDTERFWGAVADNAVNAVLGSLGRHLGREVNEKEWVARTTMRDFFDFAASSPRNVARYEAQDPTLIAEFIQAMDREVFSVRRGTGQAPAPGSAPPGAPRPQRRLPVAGRTGPVPSAKPPEPDPNDEDAVFQAAWRTVQSGRQATTP